MVGVLGLGGGCEARFLPGVQDVSTLDVERLGLLQQLHGAATVRMLTTKPSCNNASTNTIALHSSRKLSGQKAARLANAKEHSNGVLGASYNNTAEVKANQSNKMWRNTWINHSLFAWSHLLG